MVMQGSGPPEEPAEPEVEVAPGQVPGTSGTGGCSPQNWDSEDSVDLE